MEHFMIDTAFVNRIKKLSDAELERQASAAFDTTCESFGSDDEARADALQEYWMLEREQSRRKTASENR
jgi:hypothetical protein